MKKSIVMMMCVAVSLAMSLPAFAIELSPDATGVPSGYAKVKDGKVMYNNVVTAYCSATFNDILNSHGLTLTPETVADVPTSYAKVVGDKVVFSKVPTAYPPHDYHKIFTAYGLQLSPEDAGAMLGAVDYSKVVDGKIVFGKAPTAYSNMALSQILAAYKMPGMMDKDAKAVAMIVDKECVDTDGDTICDEIDVCGATPKGVKVDERGCWVLAQVYLFDFDRAEVKSEFLPLLDHISKIMSDNPSMTLQIEGHTDSVGSAEYNQGLSERRAKAIGNALINNNMIKAERIKAAGFGEDKPLMSNDTTEGRAKNRRVELMPVW